MNINWRTFVNTLRGLGLTPVRLVLVGGALALLSLPFVFVAQAAESPLQTIPAVAFASAASSGAESTTPANLEVTLSAASELTVTVAYAVTGGTATGGVDYTLLGTGTLTFVPGDTSETVAITIVDDALDEADETIEVTLSNPSNATLGTADHTYTILDNDGAPTVAFASAASGNPESVLAANLEVTLSAASELTVTVAYAVTGGTATGGVDYTLLGTGTLTFVPGDTSETVAITIVDDALDEADETIEVTLSNASNATLGTADHTYTILDNDGLIVSGQGVSIIIGDGNIIGVIIIGHGNTIGNVIIGDSTNEGDNAGRGKTAICHKGKKTLSIGYSAVSAHQAHGDTLGLCP